MAVGARVLGLEAATVTATAGKISSAVVHQPSMMGSAVG